MIKNLVLQNDIDIIFMQETEIEHGFDIELLNIPGFKLEVENNERKCWVATYLSNNVKYNRRHDLEGVNSHLQIFDIFYPKT